LALDWGRGVEINFMPWLLYPWKRDLVYNAQEAGWAPGPVWTGAVNLTPHWNSIPGQSIP